MDHCNDIDADDVNVLVKAAWKYSSLCLVDQRCVGTSLAVPKAFISHSDQGIVLLLAQQEEAMELICKLSSYAKVLRCRVPAQFEHMALLRGQETCLATTGLPRRWSRTMDPRVQRVFNVTRIHRPLLLGKYLFVFG